MYRLTLKIALALILAVACGQSALAQESPRENPEAVSAARDDAPDDVLGRGTPRGTVQGFFAAASELDWDRAAEHLDLRNR